MCTTLPLSPLPRFAINTCRPSSSLFLDKRGNGFEFLNPKSRLSTVNCSINEGAADNFPQPQHLQGEQSNNGLWSKWKANWGEMSPKLTKLGLAAVLVYGIFDGVTYTSFFVLAFLGYEKSTGNNPAVNLQALLGIVILMWTGTTSRDHSVLQEQLH